MNWGRSTIMPGSDAIDATARNRFSQNTNPIMPVMTATMGHFLDSLRTTSRTTRLISKITNAAMTESLSVSSFHCCNRTIETHRLLFHGVSCAVAPPSPSGICLLAERQRSPDGALCATYGATPCSAFYSSIAIRRPLPTDLTMAL